MTPEQIQRLWQSDVNRWHSNPDPRLRNSGDTIQKHQWRVAFLRWQIFDVETGTWYALVHDAPEIITGDIPPSGKATIFVDDAEKWARERLGLEDFGPETWQVTCKETSLCDKLDAYMWMRLHAKDLAKTEEWRKAARWIIDNARELGVLDTVLAICPRLKKECKA